MDVNASDAMVVIEGDPLLIVQTANSGIGFLADRLCLLLGIG